MNWLKHYKVRLMLFTLDFANNKILSWFFFFFYIINSYFLIPTVIAQIVILTAETVITTGIATNEASAEIETEPVTVEAKISKSST